MNSMKPMTFFQCPVLKVSSVRTHTRLYKQQLTGITTTDRGKMEQMLTDNLIARGRLMQVSDRYYAWFSSTGRGRRVNFVCRLAVEPTERKQSTLYKSGVSECN